MDVIKSIAERFDIWESHFGDSDPWPSEDGWIITRLIGMPEVPNDSIYGLTHDTPKEYEHGLHPMWV